jgi:putative ABC transport system permease protein
MQTLWQDLRYAIRMLAKAPGFTAVAVLTIALGIGANTAIFSVIEAVLLRPLPFPRSDRLVSVESLNTQNGIPHDSASYPDFFDWRKQSDVFGSLTAFHDGSYTLTGADEPAHLSGEIVTSDFFSTLQVVPELGRGFLREEEQKGHHVVVLSDALWHSRFGADPNIVGRSIRLNDNAYTVVGVAPAGFAFPIATPPVQLWTTCADDPELLGQRDAHLLNVVARPKDGITVAQAQAEIARINGNLAKQYPESNLHFAGAMVEAELQHLVGNVEPALLILFGAVGLVLLIACANVANLLLARSTTREKEMAVRAVLGAGHLRMIQQLLSESVVLSLIGGALGVLIAQWGTAILVQMVPQDIPRMAQIAMNGPVFAFTFGIALLTGILFGLAPALHSSKANLGDSLKEAARGASAGRQHNRLRGALVVSEMALALTLLLAAGLMIQSFAHLQQVSPGFNPHNLLTFTVGLSDTRYTTDQQKNFYRQLLERLNVLPGVSSAASTLPVALSGNNFDISFTIDGRPVAKGNEPDEETGFVSPGYFRTMGIPLLEGRDFADTDTAKSSPYVVIINQAFARKFFPNEDPVGKRMNPGLSDSAVKQTPMREIIGVVGNVKTRHLSTQDRPEYYVPYSQALISSHLTMILRTKAAPESVLGAARETVHSMDSALPVYNVKTMDQYVATSVSEPRFSTALLAIFGGLALALTALGIYGVVSYSVAQRTREIGIRMALGAQLGDVLKMVIRQAGLLLLIGWGAGIALSLGVMWLLASELYGISATDPLTIVVVSIVLAGVAFIASYVPARRAMRVDPVIALRHE